MIEEAGDAAGADPEKKWTKRDLRHTSAVVICPPSSQWGPIQEIRSVNDKSYVRWMPHVNLLYPFLLDDDDGDEAPRRNFDAAATAVAGSCSRHRAVHGDASVLRTLRARQSCTVWLHPSEPLEESDPRATSRTPTSDAPTARLARDHVDPSRAGTRVSVRGYLSSISPHSGYTPHLSVGQWDDVASASAAELALRDAWEPLTFEVDAVYLISRAGADAPFEFKARVPLGAAGGAWRRGDDDDDGGGGEWWIDAYHPPPPPEGACLRPRPKRRRVETGQRRQAGDAPDARRRRGVRRGLRTRGEN